MSKKKTIAVFTAPQGHKSIADAASQALEKDYQLEVFFKKDGAFLLYEPFYKVFPQVWGPPFTLSNKIMTRYKRTIKLLTAYFEFKYDDIIWQFHQKYKPDLYLSTHFSYNSSIEKVKNKFQTPFINILPDPRTVHRSSITDSATVNLVFDKWQKNYVKKIAPNAKTFITGWFVRDEFERNYQKKEVRKKLKLKDELTFLITSGSDGTNLILKLVPALPLVKRPVQIVVACGNNQRLFSLITKLNRLVKAYNSDIEIIPLTFTKEIYLWMQAADLIVGKAGPNTIFESAATLTPFFAITHISGQETGNLEIIKHYRLGIVEERSIKATKLLLRIINQPKILRRFDPYLKKVAEHNKQAKPRLKLLVDKLTAGHLVSSL